MDHLKISGDKDGCTSFTYVYPKYLLCSTLGFLGIISYKYPRDIGLTWGFPMTGYVGIGVHPCLSPENHPIEKEYEYMGYGCFQKIMVPPNHPLKNRVFHYFHHPFWGPTPIFGNTHMNII